MPGTLLSFDFSGIQRFVFATNRLRSIVGGSARLDLLNRKLTEDHPEAVVYSAGGNGMLFFKQGEEDKMAKAEQTLRETGAELGANIVYGRHSVAGDAFTWKEREEAIVSLAEKKRRAAAVLPSFVLPMGAACPLCGRGTVLDSTTEASRVCPRCQSRKIWSDATRESPHGNCAEDAHNWLAEAYKGKGSRSAQLFLKDLSELRGGEDRGLLAVLCLDASGVGAVISALGTQAGDDPQTVLKEISQEIDDCVRKAVLEAMQVVFDGMKCRPLPFRPVIVAGDDLTFLIKPELAWRFVHVLSSRFEQYAAETKHIQKVTLPAGLAIVHANYPVSEAVACAEALLANAKRAGKSEPDAAEGHVPAMIDYEVALDAVLDDPAVRRERELRLKDSDGTRRILTGRPYRLTGHAPGKEVMDSPDLRTLLLEGWALVKGRRRDAIPRSRLKLLREIVTLDGPSRQKALVRYRRDADGRKSLDPLLQWAEDRGGNRHERLPDILEILDVLPEDDPAKWDDAPAATAPQKGVA